jgi:pimeloyl-ACP methyl ester carboxylesterase
VRRDRQRFPQIGRSVDVGERSLNIFCSGNGSPAVISDSGRGMPGYSWLRVQPELAKLTRACWYDRAGYGWSDAAAGARTSAAIVTDLHQLLQAAEVASPYVLVGHSFGGLNARIYYARYPHDVSGMVLVEPSHENIGTIPNPTNVGAPLVRPSSSVFPVARHVAEALGPFGVLRLMAPRPGVPPPGINDEDWATIVTLRGQRKSVLVQEGSAASNFELVRGADTFGDLPLMCHISSGRVVRRPIFGFAG